MQMFCLYLSCCMAFVCPNSMSEFCTAMVETSEVTKMQGFKRVNLAGIVLKQADLHISVVCYF